MSNLSFDLDRSLRAVKSQKRNGLLVRRADAELQWASEVSPTGGDLLFDTTVYLDVLKDCTPDAVDVLLSKRTCLHSSVCLAELTHVFGRLDPAHPSTKAALAEVAGTIGDIPDHRLFAPDVETWGRAGMIAGELARRSGLPAGAGQERKFLNDALIFVQAGRLGASVLTRNIRDFDFLTQIVAGGRVLFYRQRGAQDS